MNNRHLRGTTAMVLLLCAAAPAPAQQAAEPLEPAEEPAAAQAEGQSGYLGTLTLTAGKRDIAAGSAVAATVVDDTEIRDRQAGTIAQLIDSVPGVAVINGATPQGSGITIRGFGANTTYGSDQKIAIQIDGASVGSEELYRMGTQLFTDPYLYRTVEVLRGTIGSFEYGSGIVGGVVKLETKNASDFTGGVPGMHLAQTLEYSSNGDGLVSSSIFAWQPTERAEFLLNYTWRQQEDFKDGSGTVVGNTAFETPSWLAKARYTFGDLDEHSVTVSYSHTTADDKDVPYDQFASVGGSFGNVDRYTDTRQASVDYRWTPLGTDLIDLSANLSYADQKIDYSYIPGSSPLEGTASFPSLLAVVNANQRYETLKLTVKNTARFEAGAFSHQLRTGVELSNRKRADNDAASAPGGEDNRVALFLVDEMKAGGWTVTPALRYETSKVKSATTYGTFRNDALMGGLALAYAFDNGIAVFGSLAYTEGLPIIDDLGSSAAAIARMNTTEKARTFEIGASYSGIDLLLPGDDLVVRANYYATRMSDVTSYSSTTTGTPLDRVETHGVELEASYGLQNGLYADLNSHIGEGTEYSTGGAAEVWRNTPAKSVGLTLGKRWNEAVDLSWEILHAADRRDSSRAALPDTTVHNLRATFRPQTGLLDGTEIRVGLENVFDLDYVGHLSSSTRPAPGRTLKLTVSKVF